MKTSRRAGAVRDRDVCARVVDRRTACAPTPQRRPGRQSADRKSRRRLLLSAAHVWPTTTRSSSRTARNAGTGNGLLTLGSDRLRVRRRDASRRRAVAASDQRARGAERTEQPVRTARSAPRPRRSSICSFGMRAGAGDLGFRALARQRRGHHDHERHGHRRERHVLDGRGRLRLGRARPKHARRSERCAHARPRRPASRQHRHVLGHVLRRGRHDARVLADGSHARPRRARQRAGLEPRDHQRDHCRTARRRPRSRSTLGGGVGPAFRFGRAQVAGYGILRVHVQNDDPNSETNSDDVTSHTVVLPGVHMAVEVPIAEWLLVRTGAEYAFNIRGTSAPHEQRHQQRATARSAGTPASASSSISSASTDRCSTASSPAARTSSAARPAASWRSRR